jgi:hypothetical protein
LVNVFYELVAILWQEEEEEEGELGTPGRRELWDLCKIPVLCKQEALYLQCWNGAPPCFQLPMNFSLF